MTAPKYNAFSGAVTQILRVPVGLRSRSFVFRVCLFGTTQTCLNVSSEHSMCEHTPEETPTPCVCVCAGEDQGLYESIRLRHAHTPELFLFIQPLLDTHTSAFVPGCSFCMSQLCESGYER